MRNKYSYSFAANGREYTIQNANYEKKYITNEYFDVKKCPKCKTVNGPFENKCRKCGNALPIQTVCIAQHQKRTTSGMLIGAVIAGLLMGTFAFLTNKQLGLIPSCIVLGISYVIGKAIAGTRITIDETATEDYRSFQTEKIKNSIRKATEDEMKQFELMRICPSCKSKIENDCMFCSNCGVKQS